MTLDHCAVEGNSSGGDTGGGIYSSGMNAVLTITNSAVDGNGNSGIDYGSGGQGAGINSDGTLTITNSSVSFNSVFPNILGRVSRRNLQFWEGRDHP